MRLNPSATPPSTKDESAFLARILANKAFSPLIPGTRSSRRNHNAIRGLQAGRAKACSCPSVCATGTSFSGGGGTSKCSPATLLRAKLTNPNPTGNRSPDSCSCIYLSTNGAILPTKVCLWFYRLHITFLWQQHLRTSPQSSRCQGNLPVV